MPLVRANPGNSFCMRIKKGDSHLNHNGLISTIPWLPFLTPTQGRFFLTSLLQASTGGSFPPTACFSTQTCPLPITPPSDWLRLCLNRTFSCTNTPTISSWLFFLPMQMERTETLAHKFQMQGNHLKERIQHKYA